MYPYEECTFRDLQKDPAIDPDSPEVLYAMAQCLRWGKGGAERDEAAAWALLREAAQAGSEPARLELQEANGSGAPQTEETHDDGTSAQQDISLDVLLEKFRFCQKRGFKKDAKLNIDRCAEYALKSHQDIALRREALEEAGAYYRKSAPEESRRYYELARELGSIPACAVLLDYYAQGIGGEKVPELENACADQLKKQSEPKYQFQYAAWCMTMEKGGYRKPIEALTALNQVVGHTEDPLLKARAQMRLHLLTPSEIPCMDCLPVLWNSVWGHEEIQYELNRVYLKHPDLPVEPEHAKYMAGRESEFKEYWKKRAEDPAGSRAGSNGSLRKKAER